MSRSRYSKLTTAARQQRPGNPSAAPSRRHTQAGSDTDILALQRAIGNQVVSQWLQSNGAHAALDGEGSRLPVMIQT